MCYLNVEVLSLSFRTNYRKVRLRFLNEKSEKSPFLSAIFSLISLVARFV